MMKNILFDELILQKILMTNVHASYFRAERLFSEVESNKRSFRHHADSWFQEMDFDTKNCRMDRIQPPSRQIGFKNGKALAVNDLPIGISKSIQENEKITRWLLCDWLNKFFDDYWLIVWTFNQSVIRPRFRCFSRNSLISTGCSQLKWLSIGPPTESQFLESRQMNMVSRSRYNHLPVSPAVITRNTFRVYNIVHLLVNLSRCSMRKQLLL